jgi:hypothetical protein
MKLARLFLPVLLLAALPAQAATTYTPDQLRLMIPLGRYPSEAPASRRETHAMSWEECLARSDKLVRSSSEKTTALRLVDAPGLRVTKLWAGDGSMTIRCTVRDGMELSRSPYR